MPGYYLGRCRASSPTPVGPVRAPSWVIRALETARTATLGTMALPTIPLCQREAFRALVDLVENGEKPPASGYVPKPEGNDVVNTAL